MLNLNQIGVHFGERTLFENISLAVGIKDRVGLVGRNGAGKSTLLKIVAGVQNASEGNVHTPKDYRIGYLAQEMEHNEDATVLEEAQSAFAVYQELEAEIEQISNDISTRTDYESDAYARLIDRLGEANDQLALMGTGSKEEQTQRVLQGLGFRPADMDRKMSEFSGGWKMRVELGKLLLVAPDLLLLDEPTNHLDIESIEWLENFLKFYPGSMVLISHDRTFLDNVTDRTVEITSTRVHDHKASYSKYMAWREEEFARQESAAKQQQKDIAHTEELINKFRAKKNKAAFAQSLIKKLDKMERIEVDQFENAAMRFRFPPAPRAGKVVVEAQRLAKRFDDLEVFKDVDLMIARQDKVALVGKNGAGKTTLFYMIAGLVAIDSGKIYLSGKELNQKSISERTSLGLTYLPQESSIFKGLTVEANILSALEQRKDLNHKESQKELDSLLGDFGLHGLSKTLGIKLSGGERRRTEIARSVASNPKFILLDEPFAGIDPIAVSDLKSIIHNLNEKGIGVVISDHNVRDTMNICTKVLIVNKGKIIANGEPSEIANDKLVKEVYLGKDFDTVL